MSVSDADRSSSIQLLCIESEDMPWHTSLFTLFRFFALVAIFRIDNFTNFFVSLFFKKLSFTDEICGPCTSVCCPGYSAAQMLLNVLRSGLGQARPSGALEASPSRRHSLSMGRRTSPTLDIFKPRLKTSFHSLAFWTNLRIDCVSTLRHFC